MGSVDAVVSALTIVTQIMVRLSPAPELWRVHKARSTGVMAFSPIVVMFVSSHVWLLYGWAVANYFPLVFVCVFGEVVLLPFMVVYARYCSDKAYVVKIILAGLAPIALSSLYVVLQVSGAIPQSHHSLSVVLGYLADATTFALFISPLEKIRLVLATKSSAAIPVLMCSVIFLNSVLWVINGLLDSDLFIIVPNSVGIVLTGMQVALYFVYRPGRHVADATSVANADSGDKKIDIVVDIDVAVDPTATPKSPVYEPLRSPLASLRSPSTSLQH